MTERTQIAMFILGKVMDRNRKVQMTVDLMDRMIETTVTITDKFIAEVEKGKT